VIIELWGRGLDDLKDIVPLRIALPFCKLIGR
jgi:hypothetical protein